MAAFKFFELPNELRNRIYEELFVTGIVERKMDVADSVYANFTASEPSTSSSSGSDSDTASSNSSDPDTSTLSRSSLIASRFERRRQPLCPPPVTCVQTDARRSLVYVLRGECVRSVLPQAIYKDESCTYGAVTATPLHDWYVTK